MIVPVERVGRYLDHKLKCVLEYLCIYRHTDIHKYIHTCIHTLHYIHIYIHTSGYPNLVCECVRVSLQTYTYIQYILASHSIIHTYICIVYIHNINFSIVWKRWAGSKCLCLEVAPTERQCKDISSIITSK